MGKLFATTVKLQKHRRKRKQPQNTFLAAAAAANNFFVFVFLLFFCFFFACFTCFSCTARFALLFTRQCCCFSHLFGHHSSLLATAGFPKRKTTKTNPKYAPKMRNTFLAAALVGDVVVVAVAESVNLLPANVNGQTALIGLNIFTVPWSPAGDCWMQMQRMQVSIFQRSYLTWLIVRARKMHWESDRWCNANC